MFGLAPASSERQLLDGLGEVVRGEVGGGMAALMLGMNQALVHGDVHQPQQCLVEEGD